MWVHLGDDGIGPTDDAHAFTGIAWENESTGEELGPQFQMAEIDGGHQVLFAFEVIVDGGFGVLDTFSQLIEIESVIPMLGEQLIRMIDDELFAVHALAGFSSRNRHAGTIPVF